ncbi:LysR family transcriptional regulator [Propionivibrio dicarboxylicus]|uniref:DNA-binding transcriptional regulator, LysR family n=1 Tax=Propionivibrio dicarboxylicus TaxID=83767 RepID=A0A1G7Z3R9_9RHOO|nr:LysR family transcriptional regulator [Propionivibrio dicarboxylicus]SDH03401.1 DNA-binding transcriptional regulator, LysR family [Propionivibrio dicarboxylicus]
MDIRYIQSFVSVVEFGSMAEAARHLDLTPAAVAARVHALEEEIGTKLITRVGRVVRPTETGILFLDRARTILREIRELKSLIGTGASVGEMRIGVFVSAMVSVLPPVLRRFYARHPELKVFVKVGSSIDLCNQVGNNDLDAAIIVEPQFAIGKGCEWKSITEEELIVVAPAEFSNREAHDLLQNEPFIRYDRSVLGGQLADRYLRDHDLRPHQRLEIDGLLAIAALVNQRLGVGLIPDWSPLWSSGMDIVRIPLPDRPPVRRVGIVWSKQGARATLSRQFVEDAEVVFAS